MEIQWYPGHMAKARRLLQTQLSQIDLAIELCDARLPLSSRNPALDAMLGRKRRVLLLCKADLAQPERTGGWLEYFDRQAITAMAYDASPQKTKQAKALIERAAADVTLRGIRRGIQKTIRAMVVGVPNVGKSTFINRLYGGGVTRVADRPGVTRANQWVRVGPYLEVLDTPGMLWPKINDRLAATRLAYIGTIRDAVYDQEALCIQLLEELLRITPKAVMERYKIRTPEIRGHALLEEVCRGRGFLMRGGVYDIERGCAIILDEFREGRVGRITLEDPPVKEERADEQKS
ncbi:MAG: ribosome biogenesis GTPase YlqF [Clostridia bacterium]|nr:ribosome biogenesis GTPase YlqF [Clostridia bacterium]